MSVFVALLRGVNVGGRALLPMADLVRVATEAGLEKPETYIASGNLVFESRGTAAAARTKLARALASHMGRDIGVFVRTASELAAVLAANPFADREPARTMVIFLASRPAAELGCPAGPAGEEVRTGHAELYVWYPDGMGRSRLVIPGAKAGTARNVNTVRKLVELAARRSREQDV